MRYVLALFVVGFLAACKKDDTPPPPNDDPNVVPVVDLPCHFYGVIDGNSLEFTQNVLGFNGSAFDSAYVVPSPSYSEAVYYFKLSSASYSTSLEICHGSVFWDISVASLPTVSQFNGLHQTELSPIYALNGLQGFQVKYVDNLGNSWKSNAASVNAQDVLFSNVTFAENTSGDYAKFTCQFNCFVYNDLLTDSLSIQNATLSGWFKR